VAGGAWRRRGAHGGGRSPTRCSVGPWLGDWARWRTEEDRREAVAHPTGGMTHRRRRVRDRAMGRRKQRKRKGGWLLVDVSQRIKRRLVRSHGRQSIYSCYSNTSGVTWPIPTQDFDIRDLQDLAWWRRKRRLESDRSTMGRRHQITKIWYILKKYTWLVSEAFVYIWEKVMTSPPMYHVSIGYVKIWSFLLLLVEEKLPEIKGIDQTNGTYGRNCSCA
jgi:hypothetical protein